MLTIGQLTRHTGVPARTIRFYHAKGIPEPERDQSGYRRYTAHDAATLIKIRTMGAAGVPLADIQRLLAATPEQLQLAVSDIEHRLNQRIQELQDTRVRLRKLATGSTGILPTGVPEYLHTLRDIGLSDQWIAMESELWILLFATHPDTAEQLLADQHQAKTQKTCRPSTAPTTTPATSTHPTRASAISPTASRPPLDLDTPAATYRSPTTTTRSPT